MDNVKVVCVLGLIGSGKDEVANYLERKYGYKKIVMGDIIREFAKKDGLDITRENLQMIQKKYRDKFGVLFFAKEVIKIIEKNEWRKIVIVGSRRPEETKFFKDFFGNNIILILVEAESKIRFERLLKRNREGDPKTFEEFIQQEKNEMKLFNFDETFKYADYKIDNNGDFNKLHAQIDEILKACNYE